MKNIETSNKFIFIMCIRVILIFLLLLFISSAFLMIHHIIFNVVIFILSFFTILFLIYVPLFFKTLKISCDSQKINITCGVFFHYNGTFTIENIQFYSVLSSPLERILKLRSVIINFSGGFAIVPCISVNDCNTITELIRGN